MDHYDAIVIGTGFGGTVAATRLAAKHKKVLLLDKDKQENFGGLAKESFGGVHLIGTPHQKRLGITDTPELAMSDSKALTPFLAFTITATLAEGQ